MKRWFLLSCLAATTSAALAGEPVNPRNLCSKTPPTRIAPIDPALIAAVKAGQVDKVGAAFKGGASPDGTDAEGFSLLHAAITEHQDAVIALLIKAGANVNQPFMGSSPLALARTSSGGAPRDLKRQQMLQRAGARLSDFDEAFFTAIRYPEGFQRSWVTVLSEGDLERLAVYVRATDDINAPGMLGQPLLFHAANVGTAETVSYLVGCGADVNARDADGLSVLDTAAHRPEIQALLMSLGARTP